MPAAAFFTPQLRLGRTQPLSQSVQPVLLVLKRFNAAMSLLRDLRTLIRGFSSVAATAQDAAGLALTAGNLLMGLASTGAMQGYSAAQLQR